MPIIAGLARVLGELDVVTLADLGMRAINDEQVVALAVELDRALLTHDEKTLLPVVRERLRRGEAAPCVLYSHWTKPLGPVIRAIADLCTTRLKSDCSGLVFYLPG